MGISYMMQAKVAMRSTDLALPSPKSVLDPLDELPMGRVQIDPVIKVSIPFELDYGVEDDVQEPKCKDGERERDPKDLFKHLLPSYLLSQ